MNCKRCQPHCWTPFSLIASLLLALWSSTMAVVVAVMSMAAVGILYSTMKPHWIGAPTSSHRQSRAHGSLTMLVFEGVGFPLTG